MCRVIHIHIRDFTLHGVRDIELTMNQGWDNNLPQPISGLGCDGYLMFVVDQRPLSLSS